MRALKTHASASRAGARQIMLLTGAAGGIGAHLAQRLYALGHALWLTDVSLPALEESLQANGLTDPKRVRASKLDVRDAAAWAHTLREVEAAYGGLDVLLNIAGFMQAGPIAEATEASVDLHLDVNVKGAIHGTRAVVPLMLKRGSGHIINLASLMAVAPLPGFALYSASKHAVRGFSIACALELRERGIYVTAVCPDAVQTEMLDAQVGEDAARLAFTGPRPLHVEEVGTLIVERVLRERPVEVLLAPRGSGRSELSKLVAFAPGMAPLLEPVLSLLGRYLQRERRRTRRAGNRA